LFLGDILCIFIETQKEDNTVKFLSVRDLRGKSAQVWKDLPQEREMVITSNGRPIAILAAVNESNWKKPCRHFVKLRAVEASCRLFNAVPSKQDNDRFIAGRNQHRNQ